MPPPHDRLYYRLEQAVEKPNRLATLPGIISLNTALRTPAQNQLAALSFSAFSLDAAVCQLPRAISLDHTLRRAREQPNRRAALPLAISSDTALRPRETRPSRASPPHDRPRYPPVHAREKPNRLAILPRIVSFNTTMHTPVQNQIALRPSLH